MVRGSHQGESHGGAYLIDLEAREIRQALDWNTAGFTWKGRGGARGLRGIAFDGETVYLAASDELFAYTPDFRPIGSWRNPYLKHCDAIAVWEPWPSTTIVKVPGSVRVVDGGCPTCYIPAAILTNRDTVAKKAEALRRFMAAFAESQQWVRQNFDAAAEICMRWIPGTDLEVMKQAIRQAGYITGSRSTLSRATSRRPFPT